MGQKDIAVIPGDGIGSEVMAATLKVIEEVAPKIFNFREVLMGGCAIDKYGVPLLAESLSICQNAEAVLLGAVGGAKWDNVPADIRPEQGLLELRKKLGVFANIRPSKMFLSLSSACPLKNDIIEKGIDFIIVRELTGGIYFGKHKTFQIGAERSASDSMNYSEQEIKRVAHVAFRLAMKRRKILTSVDKANVLASSRLWRSVVNEIASEYPEVKVNHLYVDNASMQLIREPSQFDVILTENMFGDILSDEASQIIGSIGMIPSASLGDGLRGLYEPIHGSAPDIAGQDKANPIGSILSGAMMLRYSFGMSEEAEQIERAVTITLEKGFRTSDIYTGSKSENLVTGSEMCDMIISNLQKN